MGMMQDGLYAFTNADTHVFRTCRFPFGSAQCKRTLTRLRRQDPPYSDCDAPDVPLASIAPDDRVVAYHFLVRATFFMLVSTTALPTKAIPYLMAFSTLAQIRFAYVSMSANDSGLIILPTPIQETDFMKVKRIFEGLTHSIH